MRFYFDFISPYAYLGWTQIHDLATRHGQSVIPVPILFAALLDRYGHKGPAEIPPKRIYIMKNVARLAHGFGIPIAPPKTHPFNSLLALRVASDQMPEPTRRAVIDGLFRAVWVERQDVSDEAVVAEVVAAAGLDPDTTLAAATSAAGKQRLRDQTEEALQAGVFGVPTVVVDGELFWGVDALPHLELYLQGADPIDPALVQHWRQLSASAHRRGSG